MVSRFSCSMLLVAFLDIGEIYERDPIKFDYSILLEAGLFISLIYTIPYQMYLARKYGHLSNGLDDKLGKVLGDQVGRDLSRKHLFSEFSVENLNFYESIEAYQNLYSDEGREDDPDIRRKVAENLFKRFIKLQHDCQSINISHQAKVEVARKLSEEDKFAPDLFETAANEIHYLMATDCFSRFRESKAYKEYMGTEAWKSLEKEEFEQSI